MNASIAGAQTRTAAMREDIQPPDFHCDVIPERDRVRVAPAGELDRVTTPQLERTIGELRQAGFDHIILDLRHLHFLDSAGLRLVLDLDASARADSHTLALVAGPPKIQRVFEISGTLDQLPFTNDPRPLNGR
jgi:anti-sigma B factor antagonist